jgi:acyl-CoA synthetase (AMP-forming)/AMP-acid ligase II
MARYSEKLEEKPSYSLQGELCVKTPQLMMGLKGWEAPCTDPEGFFHTGDLGFYDREGIIHFMEQVSLLSQPLIHGFAQIRIFMASSRVPTRRL